VTLFLCELFGVNLGDFVFEVCVTLLVQWLEKLDHVIDFITWLCFELGYLVSH